VSRRLLSGSDAVFACAHNGEQVEKTAQVEELPHLATNATQYEATACLVGALCRK